MRAPDSQHGVGYYFALPRLLARSRGDFRKRREQNWLEANIVGALVHLITLAFAARLLLADRPGWQQTLLLVPLTLLVWAWWSLLFYVNSLLIKLLRAAGAMRKTPDNHAQSLMVGITTTLFAWHLINAGSWMRVLGWIWIAAVALNLAAAAVLALVHADARQ